MKIEAKYLNIKWKNKNEIEKVTENFLTETLEYIDDNTYFLQLYTYTKINNLFAQIAFQVDDETITPAILLNDGSKQELKQIIDPETNKVWWVEEGCWINNKKYKTKYYHTKLFNHIGDTKIIFGEILVNINVKSISLTEEDIEIMLNDFKNELWKLIHNRKSYSNVKIKLENLGITEQYKEVLEEYINNIDRILKKPKVVLKEDFKKENIRNIKPNIKTFIEYITDPSRQYYTSKSKIESYNIPDNQYIYWTFQCIKYILLNNINYQKYVRVSTNKKLHDFKTQIDGIEQILKSNQIQINKEIFYNNIQMLLNERDELCEAMEGDLSKKAYCKKYTMDIKNIGTYQNEQYYEATIVNQKENITYRLYNEKLNVTLKNKHLGRYSIICDEPVLYSDKYAFINLSTSTYTNQKFKFTSLNDIMKITIFDQDISQINEYSYYKIKIISKQNKQKSILENSRNKQEFVKYKCYIDMSYGNVLKLNKYLCYLNISVQNESLLTTIEEQKSWFIINADISYMIPYKIPEIISILPLSYDTKIKELRDKEEEYKQNNWQKQIDYSNKKDIEALNYLKKESEIMKKNYKRLYDEYYKLLDDKELVILYNKMLTLENEFKKLKIAPSSIFPNTMTFIQNYSYSKVFTIFNLLLDLQNININQLSLIQVFEHQISITNIHQLYERWCYIVVLNVLMQYYHFKPKYDNWLDLLLEQILSDNSGGIFVTLINEELRCNIMVWYEKELSSKKIPDIVIEIIYDEMEPYQIMLDAKFHEEADIKSLILDLYYNKDYAERKTDEYKENQAYRNFHSYYFDNSNYGNKYEENGVDFANKVFILHPDFNALSRENIIVNSQEWGKYSYYGEGVLFTNKEDRSQIINTEHDDLMPNHRYGAVAINPKNYSYQTMMQRLVGMSLQYYHYTFTNEIPERWLCISCGNVNYETREDRERKIDNYKEYFDIEINPEFRYKYCEYCSNILIYTKCYLCKAKLIKNGVFWTYHNTNEDSIYNIKCPNCGANLSGYAR